MPTCRPRVFLVLRVALALCAVFSLVAARAAENSAAAPIDRVFNVRAFGAVGDGVALDTAAINRAIEACAAAGGGQVLVPPGRYLTGTLHLRSHLTLHLDAGARLVGPPNLADYQFPAQPAAMPNAKWGKWHRALIVGENLEDVTLSGSGTIDGNKVFDPTGEEKMRGPHTVAFVNCRRFTIRDLSIVDSANYAVLFHVSDEVDIRHVKITGGWDGVHWRGSPERWCRNVNIVGCQFYTGDDAIAGSYWDNTVISDCIVNSSCNGIRLIGPATRLIVRDCLFYGPGLHPHRTSNCTNMLAAINLQPGARGKTEGPLDDVVISDVTMHRVASPFALWIKPGNTAGRVPISRLDATGVYRAAPSVESWAEQPISSVVFRDVNIEFDGGGKAEAAPAPVVAPGFDARPLPVWGFYARHVENLLFEDVRLSCTADDFRPVLKADALKRLTLDRLRFTRVPGVTAAAVFTEVGEVRLLDTDLPGAGGR